MRSVPKRAVLLFEDIGSLDMGRESAEEDQSPKLVGKTGDKALEEPNPKSNVHDVRSAQRY
jgi:hypothetical protein